MAFKSRFRSIFRNLHVVLPVIHVTSEKQALRNAAVARDAGADGIFIINHSGGYTELLKIYPKLAAAFPDWWIGVNCLDLEPAPLFPLVSGWVAGVWVDNALIYEDQDDQPEAQAVLAVQKQYGWNGLYFGGVAFKYQRPVHDLVSAAQKARGYMDVITTSGPGTGQSAPVDKIRVMKEAAGEFPLAIASGITPQNVKDYLPYSDCYLVATGISSSFDELDPESVKILVKTVRAYDHPA